MLADLFLPLRIAFDDQTSTFIVPEGGGFGVVFCPQGRSSNILATLGSELRNIAAGGHVTPQQLALLSNATYIQETSATSAGASFKHGHSDLRDVVLAAVLVGTSLELF